MNNENVKEEQNYQKNNLKKKIVNLINQKNYLRISFIGIFLSIIGLFMPFATQSGFAGSSKNFFNIGYGEYILIISAVIIVLTVMNNYWGVIAGGIIQLLIIIGTSHNVVNNFDNPINAANGAAVGGILGSVVPGIGNAIGAVVGGGLGLLGEMTTNVKLQIGYKILILGSIIVIISGLLEFFKIRKANRAQ